MTNMKPVTQEVTGDDSCKIVVQTLNKVLENIIEVITCLECHTDNEHLHLFHVTSIKHYVLEEKSFICYKQKYIVISVRKCEM